MGVIFVGIREQAQRGLVINRTAGCYDYTLQLFWSSTVFWIDGKQIIAPPNSLILFQKSDPQHFYSAEQVMTNAYVFFSLQDDIISDLVFNKPVPVDDLEPYHRLLTAIFEERCSEGEEYKQTVHYLLMALLSKVKGAFAAFDTNQVLNSGVNKLQRLRDEIFADPQIPWNVTEMAGKCGLSVSRFQSVYKKAFSISPMQDVINARMILAKKYLRETDDTLLAIARNTGYQNDAHFIRQFKKMTGLTPTEFRGSRWYI